MTELPIACSLSGRDQAKRLREISDLCGRALLDTKEIAAGLRLRFAARPGIQEDLAELIEIESRCCSFLEFELRVLEEGLVLDVTGPDDARPVIWRMFGLSATEPGR